MTTYTAIANSEVDGDSPVTDTLITRLRDNPLATAEGDTSAPFLASGWHNYNGAQALTAFYDFGIHGTLATIVSPDFADGWEYLFIFDEVGTSGGTADDLRIELYRATTAAYASASTILTDAANSIVRGFVMAHIPRITANFHRVSAELTDGTASNSGSIGVGAEVTNALMTHTTAQKLLRARFSWTTGSFNAGKIFMARRQVGFTR